jgi:hypothetical protein
MGVIGGVLLWIIGFVVSIVILYWVIRMAVRAGILDADRIRRQAEKEAAVWDPKTGREGFR